MKYLLQFQDMFLCIHMLLMNGEKSPKRNVKETKKVVEIWVTMYIIYNKNYEFSFDKCLRNSNLGNNN